MPLKKIKRIVSGQYIQNVGWLGGAEIINRIFRLGTTVTLARIFTPEDYGLMAIVYTTADFFQVFTLRGGVGSKIIQADEKDLMIVCNTAYWLNWIACISLFTIQCTAAFFIYQFHQSENLALPLLVVALTYLAYPLFTINITLITRENRFQVVALCNVAVSLFSNLIVLTFALLNFGVWAIVLSMVLTMPIWIIFTWKYHSWRPPLKVNLEGWKEVLGFGTNLLISDLSNRIRANIDYLIVGNYLGLESLGLYYFAYNAGSGITLSILNSFMSPLYPYICAAKGDYLQFKNRYLSSLKRVSGILVPIILLQAFLAPIYVPIVFGEKWISAIPILMLVCLSMIPRIYGWASVLLLNAIDKTRVSLGISILFTAIFTTLILAVVSRGIFWVALTVFLSHVFILCPITLWANNFALRKQNFFAGPIT
jgi:PST family polysaccharide transporter